MALNPNSYVSWPVQGGIAFGKVTKLVEKDVEFGGTVVKASKDDPVAEVVLPSDQVVCIAASNMTEITESEYKQHLAGLAELFTKKAGINMSKEIETIKAELITATDTIASLTQEKEALTKNLETLTADLATARLEVTTAQSEIAKINKANLAKTRLAELAEVNAVAAVDTDEAKALAKLGEMSEYMYGTILSIAKSYDAKSKAEMAAAAEKANQNAATDETVTATLNNAKADESDKGTDKVIAAAVTTPAGDGDNLLQKAFISRYKIKE